MKVNKENKKLIRRYTNWLRRAEGRSSSTIKSVERAIWLYEEYTRNEDLGKFCQSKAEGLKSSLQEKVGPNKTLSVTTVYHHLRHLKAFFTWLSGQSGYRSKISVDCISYLSLDRNTVAQVTNRKPVKYPSLEYTIELCRSITVKTEIDLRDRALIAFLLLSGMRDHALASLPLDCFNEKPLLITQDPSMGVRTKFSKYIQTTIIVFDQKLVEYVLEWVEHLKTEKLFANTDPMFPATKVEQSKNALSFTSNAVKPEFWATTGPIRRILRQRAIAAAFEYYKPHAFRHAAIHLALEMCTTPEEIRAVSQNYGHEDIGTTLNTYGKLDDRQVDSVIRGIDVEADDSGVTDEEIQALMRRIRRSRRKNSKKV